MVTPKVKRLCSSLSRIKAWLPQQIRAISFAHSFSKIISCAAVYNKEEDIATYTVRAVDDPRTLNKSLYIRPPANTISTNDLVSLWEKKIGKTIERVYIPEEQVLKNIQGDVIFVNPVHLALKSLVEVFLGERFNIGFPLSIK